MFSNRRVGTDNGILLALYFIPCWHAAAMRIWEMPVRGLYDRANIAPAIFISDLLQLGAVGTVRFAWLLALAKLTVVIFFALFLLRSLRKASRDAGYGEEALSIALLLGIVVSIASMACASSAGEAEALRLHATETMLLLGGAIIVLAQPQRKAVAKVETVGVATQPLSSPSS